MTKHRRADELASLQQQLRQLDDFVAKGLMRAEEADVARKALRRRVLQAVVPDAPAPRLTWRARAWAVLAMVVLVAALAAYLLSGQPGLRRQSLEAMEAAKAARARREAAQSEAFAQLRARKASEDPAGVNPARGDSVSGASASGDSASGASANEHSANVVAASSPAGDAAPAPLLAGRVALAPALRGEAQPGDTVFVVVRLPDDPAGLPLAALRRTVADLPLAFAVRQAELVGDEQRFLQAKRVVVTARVSRSGSGRAEPGDLVGTTPPLAPWSSGADVVIDRALP